MAALAFAAASGAQNPGGSDGAGADAADLALPVTNWTVIATNQFGPGGGFNFTNFFDLNTPQQFLILRLQ